MYIGPERLVEAAQATIQQMRGIGGRSLKLSGEILPHAIRQSVLGLCETGGDLIRLARGISGPGRDTDTHNDYDAVPRLPFNLDDNETRRLGTLGLCKRAIAILRLSDIEARQSAEPVLGTIASVLTNTPGITLTGLPLPAEDAALLKTYLSSFPRE